LAGAAPAASSARLARREPEGEDDGEGKTETEPGLDKATWPREGIERARAESEDRRRPTRGVAGDDAGHGMGARTVHWRA